MRVGIKQEEGNKNMGLQIASWGRAVAVPMPTAGGAS